MNAYDQEIARLTDLRISDPDFALRSARRRIRREKLTADGRLNIIAADHPARRATAAAGRPLAMADRADYLRRILRALSSPLVDGVMATLDILEELSAVGGLAAASGRPNPLSHKLLIASLNRGGLAGTVWEMDDPVTGAGPETCAEWNLDGAKMLLRIADDDPGSLRTIEASAEAIRATNRLGLPMFLEPLPVQRTETGFRVVREAEALARIVGVATALGDGARRMWLKLPYCAGYETVARASTAPILLLGGEAAGDYRPFLEEVRAGMASAPNVRGALAGRNVLYPGDADPLEAAEAVGSVIHRGKA